jgi:hypothetical protein
MRSDPRHNGLCDRVVSHVCDRVVSHVCDRVVSHVCDHVVSHVCDHVVSHVCDCIVSHVCDLTAIDPAVTYSSCGACMCWTCAVQTATLACICT